MKKKKKKTATSLQKDYLMARKEYFFHKEKNKKDKLKKYEESLRKIQNLSQNNVEYPLDTDYSTSNIQFESFGKEVQLFQKNKKIFVGDTEESIGSIEDYLKLKK